MNEDVEIVVPCFGYEDKLQSLLESLAFQTFSRFTVTVVTGMDSEVAFPETLKGKVCRQKYFHRSKSRNLGVFDRKVDPDAICLFLDSDVILSPEFIGSLVRIHRSDKKAVVYGLRKDLKKDALTPRPLTLGWVNRSVYPRPKPRWTIRSMAQSVRFRWFDAVGGYPDYMRGWGWEDVGLHVSLVERLGCQEYICPEAVALHVWHEEHSDHGQDYLNMQAFLDKRKELIAKAEWKLLSNPHVLTDDGKWLVSQRQPTRFQRYCQITAVNLFNGERILLSSPTGNWSEPATGDCVITGSDAERGIIEFHSKAKNLGRGPGHYRWCLNSLERFPQFTHP